MRSLHRGISPVLSIRVPQGIRDKLTVKAKEHGIPRADYVRLALDVAAGELCCIERGSFPHNCPHVWCHECRGWTVMETENTGFCDHIITSATQHAGGRS